MGRVIGYLYCINKSHFDYNVIATFNSSTSSDKDSSTHIDCFLPQMYVGMSNKDIHLWHLRMGHSSDQILQQLPFFFDIKPCNDTCQICPTAKQTRAIFPHYFIQSKEAFELILFDL